MDERGIPPRTEFYVDASGSLVEVEVPDHPCRNGCRYAKDIGMPEYSCSNGCMYDKHQEQA